MTYFQKTTLKLVACFILINLNSALQAQESWASYSKKIDIKPYIGKSFRFKAKLKTEVETDSASARLWVRIDMASGSNFFENMWKRPTRSVEWKEVSIEGKIKEKSEFAVFGALCELNGKFYYDDLIFEIETSPKKWTTLYANNFENNTDDLQAGIFSGNYGVNPLFRKNVITQNTNHCLIIGASGIIAYGQNKAAGRYAEVNGIKLYYEIYGQGHPLIVLHGNGGSIESASNFYPELMKTYKVIAVDSRAQGMSGDTKDPLTYDIMASDVAKLLDQLNIDSAYVWGQSDGAILGLILAMDHPKKVSKVLAFGSNIQPDTLALFAADVKACEKICKESKNAKEAKLNCLMTYYPNIPYSKLKTIKIPVLVMAGDRDMIRPEHTLKIFQNIPNSQLFIVPGATHGACWEKPELFLQTLHNFFDKPFTMPNSDGLIGGEE
ncbi:MAG: alpha/beta hydrolase [Pedobacter sp.]|nr:alpha/beta hydrolase [Chitinophagaceae bacterium]